MFNIADNNLFDTMCALNVTNEHKRELIETKFFLGLYKDIPIIVYRYKNLDKFLNDPKSRYPGARVNYLKRIVYCRTRDWINKHHDEMFGMAVDKTDKELQYELNEFNAKEYIDVAHRLAKYLILFDNIDNKLLAKICFLYKDIEMKVNKSGKNGGLSGKNNVLERLNGRMVDDIRDEIPSEIIKVCPVDMPKEYEDLLKTCLWKDKAKSPVFSMTYNYAVSACSRLKNELDFYEDDIIDATKTIMRMSVLTGRNSPMKKSANTGLTGIVLYVMNTRYLTA